MHNLDQYDTLLLRYKDACTLLSKCVDEISVKMRAWLRSEGEPPTAVDFKSLETAQLAVHHASENKLAYERAVLGLDV